MLEWSQNIILSDGTQVNLYDTVEDFAKIINEHLGYEAEKAFREIIEETRLEVETELCYDSDCCSADPEVVESICEGVRDIRKNLDRMLLDKVSRIQLQDIARQLERIEHKIEDDL